MCIKVHRSEIVDTPHAQELQRKESASLMLLIAGAFPGMYLNPESKDIKDFKLPDEQLEFNVRSKVEISG